MHCVVDHAVFRRFPVGMSTERPQSASDELRAMAAAIRSLRVRVGISQPAAAEALGVSRQAWQNYEAGERQNILRSDVQAQIARALGLQREDLLREAERLSGTAALPSGAGEAPPRHYELSVLGRVRASALGPQIYDGGEIEQIIDVSWMFGANARTLRVAGDSMTGYVESGDLVVYDTSQWPRRGDGCVVEMLTGEIYVKEYLGSANGVLKVRQRLPEEDVCFSLTEVKGVYPVRFRGG
jgi:phage repressor protein C with HTH and peptisase S24 domain